MKKFKNKYRSASIRLQSWDYGNNGAYFITICTKNRVHYFGEIEDADMQLSDIGLIAEQYWLEIPKHFPYIELGNFVVMPNHVHGILIINKMVSGNIVDDNGDNVDTRLIAYPPPLQPPPLIPKPQKTKTIGGFAGNKNPMLNENISRIIRWYKGRCSFETHKNYPVFEWQSRFYEHIIRNPESFYRIQNYISNNPANWKEDTFS